MCSRVFHFPFCPFKMSYYGYGFDDYDYDVDPEARDPLLTALKSKYHSCHKKPKRSSKVKERVKVLKQLQGQYKELVFEERAALVDKYHKLYEPLYAKRYEIVNGITEVEGVKTKDQGEDKATPDKGVPNFWLSALKNNKQIMMIKRDEQALKYLKDIKWCRIDNPKGFKLDFLCDPNPYFRNSVLTKTYHMIEHDQNIWNKEIGMEIEWYPGKSLTVNPRKGSKNAKPMCETEICFSFFKFFKPSQYDDYSDEDLFYVYKSEIEEDHDIGLKIRDRIIPYAVSWFTGEAVKRDKFDSDSDSDSDDDEEEEEDVKYEEDTAADDNNEEEEVGKRKGSSKGNASGALQDQYA